MDSSTVAESVFDLAVWFGVLFLLLPLPLLSPPDVDFLLEDDKEVALLTNSQERMNRAGNHSVMRRPKKLKYRFGVLRKETTTMKAL